MKKQHFLLNIKITDKGAEITKRVQWSKQLTDKQIEEYTPENILGDWINEN